MFTFFFLVCVCFYTWNQVTEGLIRLFTFVVPVLFECCFFLPLCQDASVEALYWVYCGRFVFRRWKCWPPKLSQSTVHGVLYRCRCVAVSVNQLLRNVREGWKLGILLFSVNHSVGVMADKCFSCCCLMLLFYEEKCQSFPFFHLRSQPCFYLFI